MADVVSFAEAIKASGSFRRSILLGNGFSIAQGGNQFSYSSLLEKSGLEEGSPVRKVFQTLNTSGMADMSRKFIDMGAEVYVDRAAVVKEANKAL
jgi:Domain of unknown function (DUF4917)